MVDLWLSMAGQRLSNSWCDWWLWMVGWWWWRDDKVLISSWSIVHMDVYSMLEQWLVSGWFTFGCEWMIYGWLLAARRLLLIDSCVTTGEPQPDPMWQGSRMTGDQHGSHAMSEEDRSLTGDPLLWRRLDKGDQGWQLEYQSADNEPMPKEWYNQSW